MSDADLMKSIRARLFDELRGAHSLAILTLAEAEFNAKIFLRECIQNFPDEDILFKPVEDKIDLFLLVYHELISFFETIVDLHLTEYFKDLRDVLDPIHLYLRIKYGVPYEQSIYRRLQLFAEVVRGEYKPRGLWELMKRLKETNSCFSYLLLLLGDLLLFSAENGNYPSKKDLHGTYPKFPLTVNILNLNTFVLCIGSNSLKFLSEIDDGIRK